MPDFTNCKRLWGYAYNGANGKKLAIEYHGERYVLKFPSSNCRNLPGCSRPNSCINEHIASTIFNMAGISAQETLLGTYTVEGNTEIVCACKDFTWNGSRLFDFCSIRNTVLDSPHSGTDTELEGILDTIRKQQYVAPEELLRYFWDIFVMDAFLGNFDRHNGNWGFLYHDDTQSITPAPVYDCGSCLLPQADEQVMRMVLENPEELDARVYRFPTSSIKQAGRKINYYDFLMAAANPDCNAAVIRMVPRLHMDAIRAWINGVPFLNELQRRFYQKYLATRLEKILMPAYLQLAEHPS